MLNIKEYRNDIFGSECIKNDDYFDAQLFDCIKKIIDSGRNKIALFPFCKNAIKAKTILEYCFGVDDVTIVDTTYYKYNTSIVSLDVFLMGNLDAILVIVDNELKNYDNIRKLLLKNQNADNIIDAFPLKPLYKQDSRIISLELASREIYRKNIPGAVAEVGVYRGYFAEFINEFFYDRKFYLFDTFEGFSPKDCAVEEGEKYSDFKCGEWFLDTSPSLVLDKMSHPENCEFKVGYFPDTAKGISDKEKFCFVHLDTDLYLPIKAGLEYFYPRLSNGGYIFVHDFNGVVCKGVRVAVEEFCDQNNVGYVCLPDSIEKGSVVIAKPYNGGEK